MRIVCPACAAAYEVPAERLMPGRAVRCARCGTDWTPLPPEPEPGPAPIPQLRPEPLPPPPEPEPATAVPVAATADPELPRAGRRVSALGLAWALSVLILLASAWGAYAERDAIMHAWPPSIRAYAALGLAGSP